MSKWIKLLDDKILSFVWHLNPQNPTWVLFDCNLLQTFVYKGIFFQKGKTPFCKIGELGNLGQNGVFGVNPIRPKLVLNSYKTINLKPSNC
jgi:hypothetical protein